MRTTASTMVETTVRKRNGRIVVAYTHTLTLACGHVETRTYHRGGKDVAPSHCKCGVCGR